jgi:hypothetical protein
MAIERRKLQGGPMKAAKNNTLEGVLHFRIQLNPDSPIHQSVYAAVQRKDLESCSFAFTTNADEWSRTKKGEHLRTLKDVSLADVSIVCRPAYPSGTSVAARKKAPTFDRVLFDRAVPTEQELRRCLQKYKEQIFADADYFTPITDERTGKVIDFQPHYRSEAEKDAINRAKLRKLGAQIHLEEHRSQSDAELDSDYECDCEDGDCDECDDGCPLCENGHCASCIASNMEN